MDCAMQCKDDYELPLDTWSVLMHHGAVQSDYARVTGGMSCRPGPCRTECRACKPWCPRSRVIVWCMSVCNF